MRILIRHCYQVLHSTPSRTFYECGRKRSKTKLVSIVTDSNQKKETEMEQAQQQQKAKAPNGVVTYLEKECQFTMIALQTSGYLQKVTVHMGQLQLLSYLLSHFSHCKVSVYQLLEKFTMVSLSKIFSYLQLIAGSGRLQHKHFNLIVLN